MWVRTSTTKAAVQQSISGVHGSVPAAAAAAAAKGTDTEGRKAKELSLRMGHSQWENVIITSDAIYRNSLCAMFSPDYCTANAVMSFNNCSVISMFNKAITTHS